MLPTLLISFKNSLFWLKAILKSVKKIERKIRPGYMRICGVEVTSSLETFCG